MKTAPSDVYNICSYLLFSCVFDIITDVIAMVHCAIFIILSLKECYEVVKIMLSQIKKACESQRILDYESKQRGRIGNN